MQWKTPFRASGGYYHNCVSCKPLFCLSFIVACAAVAQPPPFLIQDWPGAAMLRNAVTPEKHQVETMPGGVALFDFDRDGKLDIFLANGAPQPSLKKDGPQWHDRLYRNLGGWKFEDVTERAGVAGAGYSMGVAAADYDNDGSPICLSRASSATPSIATRATVRSRTSLRRRESRNPNGPSARAGSTTTEDGDLDLSAYTFVSTVSSPEEVRVRGMELEYSQSLSFLPDPFGGLNVRASYTRNYAEVIMTGMSAHAISGGLGYAFGGASLYTNATWHDDRPTNIAGTQYTRRRVNLDVGGTYRFSNRFSLFVNVRNVLNDPYEGMQTIGDLTVLRRYELSGTNYTFGLKGTF